MPTQAEISDGLDGWRPFDDNDPRSLINIVPKEIKKVVEQVPREWLVMTETELQNFVDVDPLVNRIRLSFWAEYERAQIAVERMSINRISQMLGVPSKLVIVHLSHTDRMAWVLSPPGSYEMYLEEAVSRGLQRLREDILEMDIKDPITHQIDVKRAELLLKAIAFVDMRKNGGIVQKQLNLHATTKDFKKLGSELTLAEIDAKIKQLESSGQIELAEQTVEAQTPEIV